MKKAFITLGIIGIVFAGFTYASNTKPLTPAQKRIQAIKLAKLKKQQVKVNTGTVNTGVVNPCNEINILFSNIANLTGSYGTQYDLMSTYLGEAGRLYYKHKDSSQCYNDAKKISDNLPLYRKSLQDIAKKYFIEIGEMINLIDLAITTKSKTLSDDIKLYDKCVSDNNVIKSNNLINGTKTPTKDCGKEPKEVLESLKEQQKVMNDKLRNVNNSM